MRYIIPVISAVAALAAGVWAAPILKKGPSHLDEVISMAQIKTVTMEVRPLPRTLRGRLVTTTRVEKIFREELESIGVEVKRKRAQNIPHLVLSVRGATDTNQPGAVALYTLIAVQQDVDLKRLSRSLRVMTHITVDVHLTTVDRAVADVESRVRHAVQIHGRLADQATKALHES